MATLNVSMWMEVCQIQFLEDLSATVFDITDLEASFSEGKE